MYLTTTESVPGTTIVEFYGLVSGSSVRAKHVGRDIMASLKNLVGGELVGYTELLAESRQEALSRMIEQATSQGANAIVNIRFATSSVTGPASRPGRRAPSIWSSWRTRSASWSCCARPRACRGRAAASPTTR